jgi:hypothetical protein
MARKDSARYKRARRKAMSIDDEGKPQRFSIETARARVRDTISKSEHILSRAYGLFSDPKKEWDQIRAEETTIPNILVGYVAPLAAIPPVFGVLGEYIFGRRIGEAVFRPEIGEAVIGVAVTWIVTVALVFLLGLLIDVLADNFDGERNDLGAQKVAAYSLTPAFLSGVCSLWPPLWWISLFALGAMVWLMYRGLPIIMKAPAERALGYAATVTIAAAVAFIVLFGLASCVT